MIINLWVFNALSLLPRQRKFLGRIPISREFANKFHTQTMISTSSGIKHAKTCCVIHYSPLQTEIFIYLFIEWVWWELLPYQNIQNSSHDKATTSVAFRKNNYFFLWLNWMSRIFRGKKSESSILGICAANGKMNESAIRIWQILIFEFFLFLFFSTWLVYRIENLS